VAGSKKFSVLTGDAFSNLCTGYYAMDQNGRGVSGEFYTYVPRKNSSYGTQKFIVFAYEDGTQMTVEYDQGNGNYQAVVTNHPLDAGEYWQSEDLSDKYVHVTANKPVSALSCYDTGYFVPSSNGNRLTISICAYIKRNQPSFFLT